MTRKQSSLIYPVYVDWMNGNEVQFFDEQTITGTFTRGAWTTADFSIGFLRPLCYYRKALPNGEFHYYDPNCYFKNKPHHPNDFHWVNGDFMVKDAFQQHGSAVRTVKFNGETREIESLGSSQFNDINS